ncbi:MAG: sugar transferase [Streptococcus sp.]
MADLPRPRCFCVQKRVGKNGRYFNFCKFRSMRVDAEEMQKIWMARKTLMTGWDV